MTSLPQKKEKVCKEVRASTGPPQPQPQSKPQLQPRQQKQSKEEEKEEKSNATDNNKKKKFVSLLFLGRTGVGKTTLVYAIRDYLKNKSFKEIQKTQEEEEEEMKKKEEEEEEGLMYRHTWKNGASRTQEPYSIIIKDHPGYDVVLIDSPGIGDTKGEEQDKINWNNMATHIKSSEFNAIVFVVGNENNRTTEEFRYVVNELKKNFPTLIQDHLITVVTHCNKPSSQTIETLNELGFPIQHVIGVNNEPYDKQAPNDANSSFMDETDNDKENERMYVQNHNKFSKLLEHASNFKLFQGNMLIEYRTKRDKCTNNLEVCERKLRDLEKEIEELEIIQKIVSKMTEKEAIGYLDSLKREEIGWIENRDEVQMYCLSCKHSCHEPCQEVTTVNTDIHQCCCFEMDNFQIAHEIFLKAASYSARPGETLLGGALGGCTGMGVVAAGMEIASATTVSGPILLGTIGVGVVLGAISGDKNGSKHKKKLLEKLGVVCLCRQCEHPPQDHLFRYRFPQDCISKRNLQSQDDVEKLLKFLAQEKENLLQQQQHFEKEYLLIEYCPYMFLPSK